MSLVNNSIIKLNNLFAKSQNLPKQKSKEWKDIKKVTIGGSEISIILGINKYSSIPQLIYEKVNDLYKNNFNVSWGNLFESVIINIVKKTMIINNLVYELGSVPGFMDRQRYSPDLLGIVKLLNGDLVLSLFEFKCPVNRFPRNTIPNLYLPQIKTGLCSISECDIGIYIDSLFKICTLSDFNIDNKFNNSIESYTNNIKNDPIIIGCIYISINNNILFNECVGKNIKLVEKIKHMRDKNDIIDFGNIDSNSMIDLVDLINKEILTVHHDENIYSSNKYIYSNQIKINNNRNFCDVKRKKNICEHTKKNKYVGFLCWKLFNIQIIKVDKDNNFVETIKEPIKSYFNVFDKIYVENKFHLHKFIELFPEYSIIAGITNQK